MEHQAKMTTRILIGDCIEQMRGLESGSVDAVVTDPPAGIAFMGKEWDRDKGGRDSWIAWMQGVADECLRLLKPGGHAMVWALPRTSHWTATAWENAGFEVRDRVSHVFASGFPKSLNVGVAVDKLQGNEREVVGKTSVCGTFKQEYQVKQGYRPENNSGGYAGERDGANVTKGASEWEGYGTALKPAMEDWWLLRKPITGTVAENVLKHGCGGLNIEQCRIGTESVTIKGGAGGCVAPWKLAEINEQRTGRFPANFCHDGSDEVVGLFPVTGKAKAAPRGGTNPNPMDWGNSRPDGSVIKGHDDSGGSAARFFFCAKASKQDRDNGGIKNIHSTVKPHNLMRWLCRLITPTNGKILDPFMGSGSTGKAAIKEGFSFVGIELDPEYAEIARKRIEAVKYIPKAKVLPRYREQEEVRRKPQQMELWQ